MQPLLHAVIWVWAFSVAVQLTLLAFILFHGSFRKAPILTTYVFLNICQACFIAIMYFGIVASPHYAYLFGWISEGVTLVFQALAAVETLRLILNPYPGIWGLVWRLLALSAVVIVAISANAAGSPNWAVLKADRGYHLTFAAAFIACALLVRYYSIEIPRAYKLLLGGFCFYSCSMVLINTVFQAVLYSRYANYEPIWQFLSLVFFIGFQGICVAALYKPIPEDTRRRAAPSDDVYRQLSPQINEHLRLLNEKLMRLWKAEARLH